jgi:hypothetical protein
MTAAASPRAYFNIGRDIPLRKNVGRILKEWPDDSKHPEKAVGGRL